MRHLLFKWACRLPVTDGIPAREALGVVKSGKQGERGFLQYYIDNHRVRGVSLCYKSYYGQIVRGFSGTNRYTVIPMKRLQDHRLKTLHINNISGITR